MKDVVQNLNRAIDHLNTLDALCRTIQRRIDQGTISTEWLSSVAGLIKGNSMSANKIIGTECAVANGASRSFVAALDAGIDFEMTASSKMQVQSQDGNVVRIGPSKTYQTKGGDYA